MKKLLLSILFCSVGILCKSQAPHIIPVVVHVMHTGEPIGTIYNPSDEQIKAAIDTLNKVYSGQFAGSELGVGETSIRFQLANRDPNGICTNGITRDNLAANANYVSKGVRYESNDINCGIDDITLKDYNRWNPNLYCNIWLVHKINNNNQANPNPNCDPYAAFVSSFPNYLQAKDGIVIRSEFISTIFAVMPPQSTRVKTTLAHEIGHYLSLYHVFEEATLLTLSCPPDIQLNCGTIGDRICDIDPVSKIDNLPPRTGLNTCMLFQTNYSDYSERNIMSYSTEPVLFTPDQKTRMLSYLNGFRISLISNNNALMPPTADLIITEQTNNNTQFPFSINPRNIIIQYKETNIGALQAAGNYVSFHLSNDSILTSGANGDIFLSDTLLAALNGISSTALLDKLLTIPAGKPIGQYYIFIAADGAGAIVNECSEDNNFATVKIQIVDTNAVSQYRYWFDDNFANAQNGFAGYNNISDLQFELPVTQLSKGVHQFNIMFKETGAGWSSISSSLFYKPQLVVNGSSKFQYWFDDNFAGAYTQNIPANNNYDYTALIDVNQLSNGVHTVHYRFLTFGQTWSAVNSTLFYKINGSITGINAYQYWFDNNLTDSVTIAVPNASHLTLLADITLPNGFPTGNHTFNIRFKQDGDLWSVVKSDSFYSCSVITNASNNPICNGESVTLSASGAANYTWSGGVLDNIPFYPNATQTYTVTGTSANGCVATSTIVIQVNQQTASTTTSSICYNQIPLLWNGLNIDSSGTYTVPFVNVAGCDSIATLVLNIISCGQCQPYFTINWTPYTEALTESQSWIVTSGTVLIPSGSNVKFDADTSGYVTLNPGFEAEEGAVFVAQAYNGCTQGSPQLPFAKMWNGIFFESDDIVLYPNPTTGMIHITHDTQIKEIMVYDMGGKLVVQQKCQGQSSSDVNLSHLPNGVYHVKVDGYNSIKVIKDN